MVLDACPSVKVRGGCSTRGSPVLNAPVQLQLGSHPLFQRLASFRNARVFSKGKEVANDLRERWETSDSPLVHRIQVRACPARPAPRFRSMTDIAGRQAELQGMHMHTPACALCPTPSTE